MKKILLTFFILACPVSTNAQSSTEKPIPEQINNIAEQFFPVICKGKLPEAISFIKKCYKKKLNDNLNIEQCLIIDRYVVSIENHNDNLSKSYTKDVVIFINDYKKRLYYYYSIIPKSKSYSFDKYNQYIKNTTNIFSDKINNLYIFPPNKLKKLYNSKGELVSNPITYLYKNECIQNDFSLNGLFLIQ